MNRDLQILIQKISAVTELNYRFVEETLSFMVEEIVDEKLEPIKKEIAILEKKLKDSILGA